MNPRISDELSQENLGNPRRNQLINCDEMLIKFQKEFPGVSLKQSWGNPWRNRVMSSVANSPKAFWVKMPNSKKYLRRNQIRESWRNLWKVQGEIPKEILKRILRENNEKIVEGVPGEISKGIPRKTLERIPKWIVGEINKYGETNENISGVLREIFLGSSVATSELIPGENTGIFKEFLT